MSHLTVKLAAVAGRGSYGCLSYKDPSVYTDCTASPPQTLITGFGHFGEGLEFSEKLNVSYSILRLVHSKCCGTISEHCRIFILQYKTAANYGSLNGPLTVLLLLCAPKSNTC